MTATSKARPSPLKIGTTQEVPQKQLRWQMSLLGSELTLLWQAGLRLHLP